MDAKIFTKGSDYYTPLHYIRKFLWQIIYWTLFRFSHRLMYGWRNFLLRLMGAKVGKSVRIFPSVAITYPWNLEIGDNSIIAWEVRIYNLGKIFIGNKTIISQSAHICAGDHDYHSPKFTLLMPSITIGNEVWIAADAFIGPRVTVNHFSVVGARAVVVKDVPEGMVVGGNPAKVIKKRD